MILTMWFLSFFAVAQESQLDFPQTFAQGVQEYSQKNLPAAKEAFLRATNLRPELAAPWINLGLLHAETEQLGPAIAYFRQALLVEPTNAQAKIALDLTVEKLKVKELPRQIQTLEVLNDQVLKHNSLSSFAWLFLFFLFAAMWSLLSWQGGLRRARKESRPLPEVRLTMIALIAGAAFSGFLFGLKWTTNLHIRGTVLAESSKAHVLPKEDSVVLFELFQGLEVKVLNNEADWVQVEYPGGGLGWIPKKDLFFHQIRREISSPES